MKEISATRNQIGQSVLKLGFSSAKLSSLNWKVVRAAVCAGLVPNVAKITMPSEKFVDLVGLGKVSVENSPENFRYFAPVQCLAFEEKWERVFIHNSSVNYSTNDWSSPWVVYHQRLQTSKPFLFDCTEASPYSLLLFGGPIEVNPTLETISVNGWVKFRAVGRIGALVGSLRKKIDELLWEKIRNPSIEISQRKEIKALIKLLATDGMG